MAIGWMSDLLKLNNKIVTMFEKMDALAKSTSDLSHDMKDLSVRLARVEGVVANSSTPEILREVMSLRTDMTEIEISLRNNRTDPALASRKMLLHSSSEAQNGIEDLSKNK